MAYPTNSWSILPATQAMLNKTKCTLEEAMKAYGGGTILLCTREDGMGKVTSFFLSSSGDMAIANGTRHKAHHDQNLRSYGTVTVHASMLYSIVNSQVVCTVPTLGFGKGPLTLDSKAPLFCFK